LGGGECFPFLRGGKKKGVMVFGERGNFRHNKKGKAFYNFSRVRLSLGPVATLIKEITEKGRVEKNWGGGRHEKRGNK